MSGPGPQDRAPFQPLAWTVAAFMGGVALHIGDLPIWATATACAGAGWSLAGHAGRVRLPGRYVKAALVVALVAAVVALFHTLNGLAAGTTLLTLMGAVKLLEARQRRDRYVLIGAALYLLLAACLQRQSLLSAPLYALDAWLCCCALLAAAHPDSTLGNREVVKLAARSLLAALPIAVLGFLFFPRLRGSLWTLPDSGAGVTGLANTLTPGAISNLSESSRTAFRVWFDGPPPPPQQRYWRGPILYDFDGSTWSRPPSWWFGPALPARRLADARAAGAQHSGRVRHVYRYRITLEPNGERWWPTLAVDESVPRGARLTVDHVLEGAEPVTRPIRYSAVSDTMTHERRAPSPLWRELNLRLPPNRNPRTLALGRRLRREAGSPAAFVQAVLEYFRHGGFKYSLTPPRLGRNSVDDFLFGTRRGFCGHFASAFVTLMRAGGVPARVVTGYLGGEWNPIGHYFVVRDSDAHAWAQVWLADRGWTRIDPTAVVAPERLYHNIDSFLPNGVSAPERLLLDVRWLAKVRDAWGAANAWWTNEVIGFDLRSQLALLKRMGIAAPRVLELAAALGLSLLLWLAVMTWRYARVPRPPHRDRIARAYARLCNKLARVGLPRGADQGPLAYADSIAERRPDLAVSARSLLSHYAELRFGRDDDGRRELRLVQFEHAVSRLRLTALRPSARASRRT